jgi:hypothetical protein
MRIDEYKGIHRRRTSVQIKPEQCRIPGGTMKRLSLFSLILLFVLGLVAAQARATLTITCNVTGAQVYVAGRLVGNTTPNVSITLVPGNYQVRVARSGYQNFDTTVTLPPSGLVLPVTLLQIGASAAPVPAPQPQPASTYALTVTNPGPNAHVLINGVDRGIAPVTMQVPPGTYTVEVRAPNMLPWSQQVQVTNGPVTVTPGMAPQTFQVQASASNAPGAQIFLNGAQVGSGAYAGNLSAGTYTILIRAPGFFDYTETFNLAAPKVISVALQQQNFSFQASASNTQAQIFLNGAQVASGSYNGALPPGTYTIVIRAPGFVDYTETFNLGAPRVLSVALQQQQVSYTLSIPAAFLNTGAKGNPHTLIQVFVDGAQLQVNASGTYSGSVVPGRHVITLLGGGLKFESSVDLQPGKAWFIEPSFGFGVK